MTSGPKLLDGEAPFEVDHLRELMSAAPTAIDALQAVGAYWPPRGSTGIAHLCDVCQLPIPGAGVCSRLCAELRGRLLLDFTTFSTAKTIEPLMRVFKGRSLTDRLDRRTLRGAYPVNVRLSRRARPLRTDRRSTFPGANLEPKRDNLA